MYGRGREVEQRKGRRVEGAEMEGKGKRKKGGGREGGGGRGGRERRSSTSSCPPSQHFVKYINLSSFSTNKNPFFFGGKKKVAGENWTK